MQLGYSKPGFSIQLISFLNIFVSFNVLYNTTDKDSTIRIWFISKENIYYSIKSCYDKQFIHLCVLVCGLNRCFWMTGYCPMLVRRKPGSLLFVFLLIFLKKSLLINDILLFTPLMILLSKTRDRAKSFYRDSIMLLMKNISLFTNSKSTLRIFIQGDQY